MARPYSAGGVSIAERAQRAVGPPLLGPLAADPLPRAYLPLRVPGVILIPFRQHAQRIAGKAWGCGGEDRPLGVRSPASAI